ncbi:MAG: sensor histidine kinase [Richelia sp. RM2_1_2]|nr:sensor histidine kinase [Richelia sp. RM1_1_1]NJO62312.1 sensor histidine kinase [Richelia sp. RM2_1_2]
MVEELYTPEQLAQMHDSLWQCVLQFANLSAVQERNRIARDLHDSVGHALTGLNFQLQTAIKCQPDPIQVQKFLTEAHRLVAIATQEVRQSVKGLRSDALETQSLEMLIASLVNDFYDSTGILPQVEITEQVATPSQLIAPIYRIIQEALNNIRKYARATEVQLDICTTVTQLHLTIQDNGRGFDPQQVSGGYGLQGMQERVAVLQGHLDLESQPGNGCCINVKIPMHISKKDRERAPKKGTTQNVTLIDCESDFLQPLGDQIPQMPEIDNIPQKYPIISKNSSVKIGEWQPLYLDKWENLVPLEPVMGKINGN